MRQTRLGLSENARKASISILQTTLSDALSLRLAVKQAHWTVRGPHFQQLHELFDSFVAPLDAEIDEVAERIATLGGTPDGRVEAVAQAAGLARYPFEAITGTDHLTALAERFAGLGNTARDGINAADNAGDADTADLLTATSRFLDQSLWILEAHLDGK
ncbi:DNA starvation/stationary phase protection protein Dps [Antarctobacter sp.]|uniref:DNA starvation/stationary phase protection protein Dps n=1 Tax=Antarctobacter sp. TaxID=1872577 RepID=UPI002B26744A|nr:DNA starvation/stationary phase protection protein Dps [Antarctobacter sp.]